MRKNELVHVLGDFQGCHYVNDFGTAVKQLVQDIGYIYY
jgi:hypothetical protein